MSDNKDIPMEWIEISFEIHPSAEEALCAFLFDMGCSGIVQEDFGNTIIKAFIPFGENFEGIRRKISLFLAEVRLIFPEIPRPAVNFSEVEDADWESNWKRFFKPEMVTPELLIQPAWEPVTRAKEYRIIRIDPGPAFGTGKHPTTRMCLNAMERVVREGPWDMLDVGTGSGILAIYGALLGAERITAIDNDDEALRWAERNIALNDRAEKIELSSVPVEDLEGNFSLLTANLILKDILLIIRHLSRLTRPMGWLILSGILGHQAPEVEAALDKHGFHSKEFLNMDEWVCIFARKTERVK